MTPIRAVWYKSPRMATKENSRTHVMRVRVTEQEREFLARVALEEERSMSNVLRLALKEFYERRMEARS